jgi:hypothetical protein
MSDAGDFAKYYRKLTTLELLGKQAKETSPGVWTFSDGSSLRAEPSVGSGAGYLLVLRSSQADQTEKESD